MKTLIFYTVLFCCIIPVVSCRAEPEVNNDDEESVEIDTKETPTDLNDVLASRRSTRGLSGKPLNRETALQLLWAGQGITDPASSKRTAPSPHAKYLLTLLYCDVTGIYQFDPVSNELVYSTADDIRPDLSAVAYGQKHVKNNGAVIVITVDMAEAERLFGDNAKRYIYIEAGHIAQNILLEAVYLGLGACPVGGFDPGVVTDTLRLDEGREAVYMITVGYIE